MSGSWPSVRPVLGLGGGDLGEWREEMCGDTRHEARLLVSPWEQKAQTFEDMETDRSLLKCLLLHT